MVQIFCWESSLATASVAGHSEALCYTVWKRITLHRSIEEAGHDQLLNAFINLTIPCIETTRLVRAVAEHN